MQVSVRAPRRGRSLRRWLAGLVTVLALAGCGPDPISGSREGDRAAPTPAAQASSGDPTSGSDAAEPGRPQRKRLTVLMTGDVLLHDGLWHDARLDAQRTGRGAMDFRPLLANMRPAIHRADLAICHLETPLAPAGGPLSGYPLFSAPPAIAPALRWAGYDACTTASNHTVDRGFDGIKRTIDDLDQAGIAHTGSFTNRRDAQGPLWLRIKGVEVVLISATFGLNGLPLPDGRPWAVNLIDPDRIIKQATAAREAGADIVLVALHWGDEYVEQPSAFQVDVATRLAKSGQIDLIYGHHAHVVQPYDKVHGVWVLYGMGNAVAQQEKSMPELYVGNAAQVTFTQRPGGAFKVSAVQYRPTMVTFFDGIHPMGYLDAARALNQPAYAGQRARLRDALARVRRAVGANGAFTRGVTRAGGD
ncbi:MAG: CapA family protein [Nocardioidaceae bacterium]